MTINSNIKVSDSAIHGKGLFARKKISKDSLIGEFQGKKTKKDGMHVLWVEDDNGEWIGLEGMNEMRFLNHADQPNAEFYGLSLYALRDIPANTEITIDYQSEIFE